MRPRLALAAAALALACAGERPGGPPPAPADPPAAPATGDLLFSYSGGDCEFSVDLTLARDGAWTRLEHSGAAPPSGRLDARALAHFEALLRAARFAVADATPPCEAICAGHATYRDHAGGRVARGQRPCGDRIDRATERLPGCLELLFDDPAAAYRACPVGGAP